MSDLFTEEDLARARNDPCFRQQFLAQYLDRLLTALKKMRQARRQNAEIDQPTPRRCRSRSQAC